MRFRLGSSGVSAIPRGLGIALAAVLSLTVARSLAVASPPVSLSAAAYAPNAAYTLNRKQAPSDAAEESKSETCPLATLYETHTEERLLVSCDEPSQERFAELLRDRTVGEARDFDPRLLGLLRSLIEKHPGARVELVSGYRSPKRNEMMRKKGRHVASHSQHSLGHAVDFRIVPSGAERGIHPRELEKEIRGLGWKGGVGVYTLTTDWFVHADVGKERRWGG